MAKILGKTQNPKVVGADTHSVSLILNLEVNKADSQEVRFCF